MVVKGKVESANKRKGLPQDGPTLSSKLEKRRSVKWQEESQSEMAGKNSLRVVTIGDDRTQHEEEE